jgi:hypothetical protein
LIHLIGAAMFKRNLLIGSAVTLICGSVWAADEATQYGLAATAPAPTVEQQDAAEPFQTTVAAKRTDVLVKALSDAQSQLEKLQATSGADSAEAKALQSRVYQLRDQIQAMQLQSNNSLNEARIKPLAMKHDQLQMQLAAAASQYGANNPELTKLRDELQLVDVQIASIQDMTRSKITGAPVAQIVDGTYLGLSTEPVTDALAQQLKLDPGFGLTVQSIVPGSPAESAGIKKFDILTKLDDQMLITPVQLQTLIRSHKPDDEIKITLIHEGQTATLTAKLSKGFSVKSPAMLEVPRMEWVPATPGSVKFTPNAADAQTLSPSILTFDRLTINRPKSVLLRKVGTNEMILSGNQLEIDDQDHKSIFSGSVETAEQRKAVPEEFQKVLGQMLEKQKSMAPSTQPDVLIAEGAVSIKGKGAVDQSPFTTRRIEPGAGASINQRLILWTSKSHTLVLTFHGDTPTHLLAKDMDGNSLFDGPIETKEQQDKIPVALRDGFDFLSQHPDAGENLLKQ